MAISVKDVPFTINLTSSSTGEKYFGEFRCLKKLPFILEMQRDRLYREYLGDHPQYAEPRIIQMATIFATLAVSVTQAPDWWKAAGNGLSLDDDDVIRAVYEGVDKIQSEYQKELAKKTEGDAKVLKNKLENPDPSENE